MARVAMLAIGTVLIALPAPQGRQNRPWPIVFGPDTEAPLSRPRRPSTRSPLDLPRRARPSGRCKLCEFVARYHYLGYKTLVGAQMRYAVHDRDGCPLAMLELHRRVEARPARQLHRMEADLREKNLPFVVDNPRFLILPWINIPNLRFAHPGHHPPAPAR